MAMAPPKNKSTKNTPQTRAKSTRSCGPPTRFGDSPSSMVQGGSSTSQQDGQSSDDEASIAGSVPGADEGIHPQLLNPTDKILQSLETLTRLSQNQHMEQEKTNRATEKMVSDMEKLQRRIGQLEREKQKQATVEFPEASGSKERHQPGKGKRRAAENTESEISDEEGVEVEVSKKKPAGAPPKKKKRKEADDTSEGELSSDDEDDSDDDSTEDAPLKKSLYSSFGHRVGNTLSKKHSKKISSEKFIEFSEILPQFGVTREEEFSLKSRGNQTTFVKRKNIRDLPFPLWLRAYDTWMAVYVKSKSGAEAVELMQDLLTYKKNIELLQRRGHNFSAYDRHFRMEQETNPVPWWVTRHDLLMEYPANHSTNNSFRYNAYPNNQKRNFNSYTGRNTQPRHEKGQGTTLRTAEGVNIPPGLCAAYNSKSKTCQFGGACRYTHKCTCGANHPVYSCRSVAKKPAPSAPLGAKGQGVAATWPR